jgi:DNA-binding NarL/FixJ family response regulator
MEGLSLLLVEDDDLIRESLLDWLASVLLGSELVGVPSDAVSSLSRSQAPEVIVVDVALPASGGVEMVRSLHHVFPAAQIVALVVGGEHQHYDAIRSAGARACLPIWKVHEALVPVVQRLWDG